MKGTIIDKLKQSALKTVDYFQSELQHDGSFGEKARDLACYFKVPMMFVSAKKAEHSQFVLSYIQSAFMTDDGDFKTEKQLKSVKPEYAEFWCYPNGWIIRAAQKTKRADILEKSYRYFVSSVIQTKALFLTNNPELKNGITDLLTAAHHGLVYLEQQNLKSAKAAGDLICDAISQQKQYLTDGLYLRLNNQKKIITNFDEKNASFYFIDKHKPQQLYFMIGYPCAFLALLFKATDEKKYLEYAKTLLDFALSCHNSIFTSHFSHKIAWAASILYSIKPHEHYLNIISNIADYFIEHQAENGLWFEHQDITVSYDQSAEIAYWFLEIAKNLK